MKVVIGVIIALVYITCYALLKSAGNADKRLEELQRLAAKGEAGGIDGN